MPVSRGSSTAPEAVATGSVPGRSEAESDPPGDRGMATTAVVITQNDSIEQAIVDALRHIPLETLVSRKLLAVKPNETWASAEDTTGVTQPDTLRAVLRVLKRYGPRELVVSGGAGAAETDDVFRVAGLMDVVEEEGAAFFDHNRPPFREVSL